MTCDQLHDAENMDDFQFPSPSSTRCACIREERSTTADHDWSDDEDMDQFFKSSPIAVYSDSCTSDDSSDEEPDENPNRSLVPSQHGAAGEDDSESQSNSSSDSDASPSRRLINLDNKHKPEVLERRLRSE
jgi:hypothetical protein